MNNLIYSLADTPERSLFGNSIRTFFSWIITAIYNLIGNAVDLMYRLASHDYGLNDYIDSLSSNLFNILIIFMLFKLTISIMTYLVNPEAFYDKNKGFSGIIKRVIISIILLVSINPIFSTLYELQSNILEDDAITTIFAAKDDDVIIQYGDNEVQAYGITMSPHCNPDLKVYTFSKGDRLALLLFQPFFQPYSKEKINNRTAFDHVMNNNESYCGININDPNYDSIKVIEGLRSIKETLKDQIGGPNSVDGMMQPKYYNLSIGEACRDEAGQDVECPGVDDVDGHGTGGDYFMNFNFIIALLAGILGLLIIITFCFDVVIRSFTLVLLQVIAPVPIISYVSPGKSSEMLSKWGKKILATWVSLFVRIAVLSIAISFVNVICKQLMNNLSEETLMFQVFVILGILMFAKQLPKLLEELFPGLKLGGMQLNPLKRISKDALGGQLASNVMGRSIGMTSGAIGGMIGGGRAGKEVGREGFGRVLGALSGAHHGFHNKKWSFDSGMNNSFKNLTGNEMRRTSLLTGMLNKKGAEPISEAKEYVKKGYSKLNDLNTALNISESLSASYAGKLKGKGYNINNHEEMKQSINRKVEILNSSVEGVKIPMEKAKVELNNEEMKYLNNKNNYESILQRYETTMNNKNSITNKIKDIDETINSKNNDLVGINPYGTDAKKIQNDIKNLQIQKNDLEVRSMNIDATLNTLSSQISNEKTIFDESKSKYNNAKEKYDNFESKYIQLQEELKKAKDEQKTINEYVSNRENETEIRAKISALNKDLETIKGEKKQLETFYRVDSSPQSDYKTGKENIDSNKYNID